MKVSEIIGSPIKSTDGGACGYVRGVYACGSKIACLACADGEEREFNADVHGLKFTPGGVIFNGKSGRADCVPVRLGIPAYTERGTFAGYVKDVFTEKGEITCYLIGGKRYRAAQVSAGDAVIIHSRRILKYDVVKGKKVILKKGTAVDEFALKTAEAAGEYVQTQLKSL